MNRPVVIVGALIIFVIAGIVYLNTRAPAGVTAMGDDDSTMIVWISLAAAVISLVTAVIGIIQKLVEMRATIRG